ncbi:bifunctional alpha,alpha-trehalose-phosphate synthase (UDP-forming)/trehalose-phosphatase [Paradesertivirga mongoliensis]|uniref:Bifunctional alpha,alpha-trehalose-phosphate synthase (UDP-forming)/trehalose-phosphatase n=1 Tax=Paradesertivirga mongoliensis TaxID=2100740 RepID=A0ABW4ZJX3_9SPHI|nr:bifunctional alpha,alpha-trehalose-phosphate synthase (UDP-forming)/trehalose-phosphatase [Pedobacter mongoliensis]
MGKTIIISNRLPVKIYKNNGEFELKQSEGGLATGLGAIYRQADNIWIGWPGMEVHTNESKEEIAKRLAEINLRPVFLTQEDINCYYEGFSNEVMWPICHYHPTYAKFDPAYWQSYQEVNAKFRDAVLQIVEPDDIIWIHDYQLLLLPGLIRAVHPDITIGFFQHIPFPSSEIFRLIPWRIEILENMLGADLIGFHTFDDARHFISSITRLLPVHSVSNVITYNDRPVVVESFPMGIDDKKFESMPGEQSVVDQINELKQSFDGFKMVLSIDRLDYSKGILQRLEAFDLLFQQHPEYIGETILYMIVVPSRDTVPRYKELRDEIDKVVGNINSRYRTLNWSPVHYYYRSVTPDLLSALYSMAEVCLVTPMRDGMNLVSKEYVASRTNNTGVLILSEMAGAAKELIDAIIVNPNNTHEICQAIIQALNMSREEQQQRMKKLRSVVSKFNIRHWVKIYMDRLNEVKHLQESMKAKHLIRDSRAILEQEYLKARKRIIFLDYDGTLVGFQPEIEMAFPDEDLYEILKQLASDSSNHVVIISGRKHENLEEWFSQLPIDIIAEHGAWTKNQNEQWIQLPGLYDHWKQDVAQVLERYVDRTPGSFIEEKSFSLVFHYRKVEEGLGDLRAGELVNDLRFITADMGLQILPGNKVIEIKNIEVNKGKVALRWLEDKEYDFIMAMGDDHTDEDIFKAVPSEAFTIKIGGNISAARFYLRDFREVRRLLRTLTFISSETT